MHCFITLIPRLYIKSIRNASVTSLKLLCQKLLAIENSMKQLLAFNILIFQITDVRHWFILALKRDLNVKFHKHRLKNGRPMKIYKKVIIFRCLLFSLNKNGDLKSHHHLGFYLRRNCIKSHTVLVH